MQWINFKNICPLCMKPNIEIINVILCKICKDKLLKMSRFNEINKIKEECSIIHENKK